MIATSDNKKENGRQGGKDGVRYEKEVRDSGMIANVTADKRTEFTFSENLE